MGIEDWSEEITVVELNDDPQFSDDLAALGERLDRSPADVVLNFAAVSFINSSDVARLLRLRKRQINAGRHLLLCGVNTQVWGVFLVTGLDKIFEFINDIPTALATLQMAQQKS